MSKEMKRGPVDITKDIYIPAHPNTAPVTHVSSPMESDGLFAVGTWLERDSETIVYKIGPGANPEVERMTSIVHPEPVMATCWKPEGTVVFGASCDGKVLCKDINSAVVVPVAAHTKPISSMHYIQTNLFQGLVTGGWDNCIRFWDFRQPSPIKKLETVEKVYSLASSKKNVVFGGANRLIGIYNLNDILVHGRTMPSYSMFSPLKWQTRCVAVSPDDKFVAIGSFANKIAIENMDQITSEKSDLGFPTVPAVDVFTNSQSTDSEMRFAINSISFHPRFPEVKRMAFSGTSGQLGFGVLGDSGLEKIDTSHGAVDPSGEANEAASIASGCFVQKDSIDYYIYARSYDYCRGFDPHLLKSQSAIYAHRYRLSGSRW